MRSLRILSAALGAVLVFEATAASEPATKPQWLPATAEKLPAGAGSTCWKNSCCPAGESRSLKKISS